jgi:hypothetical protein
MRNLILLSILFHLYQPSEAQIFQFQMFFEDAIGNRYTLTIGYDVNGTELIDPSFGETNIIGIAWDSIFDVRITDAFINKGIATFHTKKQIVPDSCTGWRFPVVSIDIKSKYWPITATWDNSLFGTECIMGSVFTSFHPGGWFDFPGFPSNLNRVNIAFTNQVTFTSNYNTAFGYDEEYAYVNSQNDTIPYFWMAFGDSTLMTWGVESIICDVKSYPNPVKDLFYIDNQNHSIKAIKIIDMMGRSQMADFKDGHIDMREFQTGYYLIMLIRKDGKTWNLKIMKE